MHAVDASGCTPLDDARHRSTSCPCTSDDRERKWGALIAFLVRAMPMEPGAALALAHRSWRLEVVASLEQAAAQGRLPELRRLLACYAADVDAQALDTYIYMYTCIYTCMYVCMYVWSRVGAWTRACGHGGAPCTSYPRDMHLGTQDHVICTSYAPWRRTTSYARHMHVICTSPQDHVICTSYARHMHLGTQDHVICT